METLQSQICTPVAKDSPTLSEADIQNLLGQVKEWIVVHDAETPRLRRTFTFKNFRDALDFTIAVGESAEKQDHHPLIELSWGRVTVDWWTHVVGGLHQNDFVMAARLNDIYSRWALISGEKDVVEEASEQSFPASDPPAY